MVVLAVGMTLAAFVPLLAERARPATLTRKKIGAAGRESLIRVLTWLTWPLGLGQPDPRRSERSPAPPGQRRPLPPVLLLCGPPQGRLALEPLAAFLRRRGHAWAWSVRPGKGPLAARAEALAERVRTLKAASGAERVDLVAHGLGGLAAAWYVAHLGGAEHVRCLVTLGTPWRGTRMAAFTRAPLGPQALPGASVLDGLAPSPVRTVCIWGTLDPMVLPQDSAIAEGATAVRLSGAAHLDLLLSARAWRAVHTALFRPEDGP